MALQKLQFKPGVNRDVTNYSNEGGWFECDKVRFLNGYPEKIKGWEQNGVYTLEGTCRALFGWITSFSDNFLAIGTNSKVYIDVGENLNDITPIRATSENNNIFAATDGSSTIVVYIYLVLLKVSSKTTETVLVGKSNSAEVIYILISIIV
jgi:hypothetical protein